MVSNISPHVFLIPPMNPSKVSVPLSLKLSLICTLIKPYIVDSWMQWEKSSIQNNFSYILKIWMNFATVIFESNNCCGLLYIPWPIVYDAINTAWFKPKCLEICIYHIRYPSVQSCQISNGSKLWNVKLLKLFELSKKFWKHYPWHHPAGKVVS